MPPTFPAMPAALVLVLAAAVPTSHPFPAAATESDAGRQVVPPSADYT